MLQSNIDENNKQLLDEAELKHAHIPLSMLSSLLHLPVPRQIQDIQGCLI